jgi:DNA-binding beta-propeller fold protein YncE
VKNIERRKFLFVILAIIVTGTVALLSVWYFSASVYNPQNSGSSKQVPKYVSSIDSFNNRKFLSPMGIATDDNNIYILDSANRYLAIYSQNEDPVKYVSLTEYSGKNMPVGIAVDKQSKVYISVIGNANKIAVFESSGNFVGFFPSKGNQKSDQTQKTGQSDTENVLGRPVGLFADNGKLYVTDVVDQNIKVFDLTTGKLLLKFGQPGSGNGQFLYPNGITTDKSGDIFVSDSNNTRIQVFNSKGSFLYAFAGSKKDHLALPRGLAFDDKDRLHVVDTLKHKVFVFSKQGNLMYSYGNSGDRAATFSYPNAIAFGSDFKKIYIADKQNNRTAIWKP